MVSGTPVLTTKLPGMPEEYKKYVYLIEDETVDGIRETIEKCIKLDKEMLSKKGEEAKKFVLENKNNIKQGSRIFNFLKKI